MHAELTKARLVLILGYNLTYCFGYFQTSETKTTIYPQKRFLKICFQGYKNKLLVNYL